MSIQAYVGLPRSGKTYNAVANTIIPALRAGRTVVTNIPLHMDRVLELYPLADVRPFPINEIAQEPGTIYDHVPHGCVLVMDEVWRLFPAGLKAHQVPTEFKQLLAEHGHMVDEHGNAMSIVLVTQDLAQISAFARVLVEQTFLHTKLSHLGTDRSFRVRIFHGPVTGQNPPKSSEVRMILGRYDERIYRLYKSHTLSKAGEDGANEQAMDTRGNVWKRPAWLIGAAASIVVAFWSFSTLGDIFGGPEQEPTRVASVATNARSAPATVPAKSRTEPKRDTWRVSGFVDLGTESIALLESESGELAMMDASGCQRSRWMAQCRYRGEWVPYIRRARRPEEPAATPGSILPGVTD